MNERKLIKELGLKSTMKIRDYFGMVILSDSAEEIELLKRHIDIEPGDHIFLISLKSPKLKKKSLTSPSNN